MLIPFIIASEGRYGYHSFYVHVNTNRVRGG